MAARKKWGKIGPPHSAKRKRHMARIARKGRRKKKTTRRRRTRRRRRRK